MLGLLTLAFALSLGAGQAQPAGRLPDDIAGKPLHELLEKWPDQYVKWIITRSEKNAYEALQTDERKLQFIEFFWARRDPNPQTPVNEYRQEYLERYAFVMNHLSAGKPGWATDRGRLYLILGPPHSIQQNPMGRTSLERPSEIWTYNNLDIPGFPASFDFQFVDFKGTGEFELVQDIDQTAPVWNQFGTVDNALDAIAQRRQRIGEVDQEGLDRFKNVDDTRLVMNEFDLQARLKDVYETPGRELPPLQAEVAARAAFGDLPVTATGGAVWEEGDRARVPVQLTVPYQNLAYRTEGAKLLYDIDYVIIASKEDGAEVARAGDTLTLSIGPDEQQQLGAMRLSISEVLQVPPGSYKVVSYIRDRNRNHIGHVELPLEVEERPSGGLALS